MTNLHKLFDEATAAAPPSRLSVEDVFSATRSHRRRRYLRGATAAFAALATAAAGGIAFMTNFAAHPPSGAAPPGPVVWVERGDAAHIYLVRNTCGHNSLVTATPDAQPPAAPCHELLASSDGGVTWVSRGEVEIPPRVLGARTLMRFAGPATTPAADPATSYELSTDGGVTWNRLPGEGPPIGALPPGGAFVEGFGRELTVYDPAQGRLRKLAHQPKLLTLLGDTDTSGSKDIWIAGRNPDSLRSAVAASHDGGATWTETDLPGSAVVPQPTLPNGELDRGAATGQPLQLITRDGVTAYATIFENPTKPTTPPRIPGTEGFGWLRTYSTSDGGVTWRPVADEATTPSYSRAWITSDGWIVVALTGRTVGGVKMDTYAKSRDGVTYLPAELTGLPPSLLSIDGSVAFGDHGVYVSDDGWSWREVWHD